MGRKLVESTSLVTSEPAFIAKDSCYAIIISPKLYTPLFICMYAHCC